MTPEQLEQAKIAINEMRGYQWVEVYECAVVQRGNERYAVEDKTAFLLNESLIEDSDSDSVVQFEPVIIDGKAFFMAPEEGKCGVLHIQHWTKKRGKPHIATHYSWLPCRWIRKDELELSNAEILEHIVEEIEDCQTPLTGLDNATRG